MDEGVVSTTGTSEHLSAVVVSSREGANRAAPGDIITTRAVPNLVGVERGPVATRSQSSLVRTARILRGTVQVITIQKDLDVLPQILVHYRRQTLKITSVSCYRLVPK